ncbi:hypothetical protein GGX14DRAFT_194407 [Mycena pura]|uniref:Uncharacterized protein n=1 Tax=Mycena pura TaxID=153505 RepID=A0AAD6V1A7_9AGAR|nr:hypothetical protein GGX14DRAFT_194407 [Mycena pura]
MATHSSPIKLKLSPSPSSASESQTRSRASVSAPATAKKVFDRADTTFNPSPYNPPYNSSRRALPLPRPSSVNPTPSASFGTYTHRATVPPYHGMFVHPPYTNLPDGVVLTEPMSYTVMHEHPTWFLDIKDFITLDSTPEGGCRYPRDLEPPRPRRQKDLLLRCTFCPRTYAGVNAKSMWTRHVREKHRVVLSKAWSDTATSVRRLSSAKTSPTPSTSTPGMCFFCLGSSNFLSMQRQTFVGHYAFGSLQDCSGSSKGQARAQTTAQTSDFRLS